MQKSNVPRMLSRRQALRRLAAATGIVIATTGRRALSADMRGASTAGANTPGVATPGAATPGAAAPGANLRVAQAPHLDVKDPSAVAVGYVEDAAKVDAKKYPTYSKGSNCENCLQLQGAAGASYRPCTLFPGKLVAVAGWCSAWTAEI